MHTRGVPLTDTAALCFRWRPPAARGHRSPSNPSSAHPPACTSPNYSLLQRGDDGVGVLTAREQALNASCSHSLLEDVET